MQYPNIWHKTTICSIRERRGRVERLDNTPPALTLTISQVLFRAPDETRSAGRVSSWSVGDLSKSRGSAKVCRKTGWFEKPKKRTYVHGGSLREIYNAGTH